MIKWSSAEQRGLRLVIFLASWVLLAPSSLLSQVTSTKASVHVVDYDLLSRGVKSRIYLIRGANPATHVADTNDNGVALVACSPGDQLMAKPLRDGDYYDSDQPPAACASAMQLLCKSRTGMNVLENAIDAAVSARQYGKAAQLSNELAARERSVGDDNAQKDEMQAYEYASKALDVNVATTNDPKQGRAVMSPELNAAVVSLQQKSKIPETGKLDYKTLRVMSGADVGAVVSHRGTR